MQHNIPPARGTAPARNVAQSGYRKGEETRARILAVALTAFGKQGFAAVTTRQIADQADVKLPALNYYFGGKEGLYLACAQNIVAQYRDGVGNTAQLARAALDRQLAPGEAAELLKHVLAALGGFLLASSDAISRTLFVQREIASPGPAFEVLYAGLWRPGIELTAELVMRARPSIDDRREARLRAAMMISSLTGLVEGRDIISRSISDADQAKMAIAIIEDQIDRMVEL